MVEGTTTLKVWQETIGPGSFARDICVNSPTGSGKTLAYALPIVQILSTRAVKCLRALVVLPTRDLALQVRDVFATIAPAVGLSVGLAVGQSSIADEISMLIVRPKPEAGICYDPAEHHSTELQSAVDILVATPGRLMDHINNTKGFTLEHLHFLVVDVTDRLLREAYQSWLPTVLQCTNSSIEGPYAYANNPIPSIFGSLKTIRRIGVERGFKSKPYPRLVKMVLSATLTQDPSKLAQLDLHHPLFLTTGQIRYQLPEHLESFKLICEPKMKPLYLVALLQSLQGEKCIVFTSSVESTHRLCTLLKFFGDLGIKIKEYSGHQHQTVRSLMMMKVSYCSKTLRAFREGGIQVVSFDAMTRGMDVEGVRNVINYDKPPYIKTYIHRAGRTARAGNSGRCFTLLHEDEVNGFKKLLKKADIDSCPAHTVPSDSIESFRSIYASVLNHIDGSPQPASTDTEYAAWKELDALVSQWIYSTLSDDLLTRVLDMDATAHDTWLKLEKIFLSNKQAKAGALETQFVNLTLAACSSVDDYCQQLKNLANQLADVDQPVNDKRFAQQHGLLFRFSCPQTSSQNGRCERMIRRLNDILRSLLIHAHLPPSFWVEALHTATYLHNILPSKRLNYFTPTFALYLRHPTYDHLRVFGCACYPNTSATQPHKLHPRAIRCIFLGYPPDFRGYRCFDPTTGKVSISRHVTFDETVFPYSIPTPTSSYSFLDDDPPPGFSFSPRPSPPPKPLIHSTSPFPFHYTRRPKPAATAASSLSHPRSAAPAGQPPSSAAPSATGQPSAAQTALPQPIHPPTNTHPMTTRSKARHTLLSTTISPVPTSYHKAFADPHWLRAMQTEFSALKENDTWDLVPRPVNRPVIRCMWLFRHKFKSDGSLERYKARLVVNGKSQTVGIDCEDTFSPVVKPATIRTVLSVAVSRSWPIHQLDVKNAFLHGHLNEIVYMQQPPGFVDRQFPNFVCRLKKSLYGLKQAPHDIVITASSDDLLQTIIRMLSREFAMTDLDQSQYAKDIISRASMSSCKPCTTPVDLNAKLSATDGPLFHDPTLYRSLAGALQYLTFTRPDISYAVQQVCLFMHEPHEPHFAFLKRIIRYLQGTLSYGIRIVRSTTTSLVAYSDADWGGCPDSRRSTSGYCVFFGDNLISWSSKRQSTVSRSSAEAEYRGVANAVAEATWVRNLLLELQLPLRQASVVYCDNVSAVYLSDNPVQHQRTKHIEIDIHFVREKVRIGHIRVLHVPSSLQYADIFTKGLPRQLFESFRSSLSEILFSAARNRMRLGPDWKVRVPNTEILNTDFEDYLEPKIKPKHSSSSPSSSSSSSLKD
ncbi:hypothetical protein OSB04_021288 [Centaurea solstitialis]|uniref:Uncharacterized protein n=1 Tax=Centaurea solstitialis TaxID=347529 RepID=A0AA38STX1_9ASTR|nr:hypothetical protein OSB04_021288 [Centaurea solstitialis]